MGLFFARLFLSTSASAIFYAHTLPSATLLIPLKRLLLQERPRTITQKWKGFKGWAYPQKQRQYLCKSKQIRGRLKNNAVLHINFVRASYGSGSFVL